MPVHVKCPGCGSVLAAPDSAAGTVLSCPQCHNQFMVPGAPVAAATLPPMTATTSNLLPPMATAAPSMLAGAKSQGPNGTSSGPPSSPAGTSAAPPSSNHAQFYPPGHSPPPLPPSAPFPERNQAVAAGMAPPVSASPVSSPPASRKSNAYPPGAAPLAPAPTAPMSLKQMATAPSPPRQAQAAKFIAADATATRIDLGADGRLPSLQLEELDEDEAKEEPQASNPWVLIGVLGFSIAASVAMLFFEPSSRSREPLTKEDARKHLRKFYVPSEEQLDAGNVQLKPYQKRLQQALIAYNRGDFADERQYYREVLDMLHVEGKNEYLGITGNARGDVPPNDRDLEVFVSALLNSR